MEPQSETVDTSLNSLLQIEEAMFCRYRELIQAQIQKLHETRVETDRSQVTQLAAEYIQQTSDLDGPNQANVLEHNVVDGCTQTSSIESLSHGFVDGQLKSNVFNIALYLRLYLKELSQIESKWRTKTMPSTDMMKRQEAAMSLDTLLRRVVDWTVVVENECQRFADILYQTEERVANMARDIRNFETCFVTSDIIIMLTTHHGALLEHHNDLRETGAVIILDQISVTLGFVCTEILCVIIEITERISAENMLDSNRNTADISLCDSDYQHGDPTSEEQLAVEIPTGSHSNRDSTTQQLPSQRLSAFPDIAIPWERQAALGETEEDLPEIEDRRHNHLQDSTRERTLPFTIYSPVAKETKTQMFGSCSKNVGQQSVISKNSSSIFMGEYSSESLNDLFMKESNNASLTDTHSLNVDVTNIDEQLHGFELEKNFSEISRISRYFSKTGLTQSESLVGLTHMDESSAGSAAINTSYVAPCSLTSVSISPSLVSSVHSVPSRSSSKSTPRGLSCVKDVSQCALSNSSTLPPFVSTPAEYTDSYDIFGLFNSSCDICDLETEGDKIPMWKRSCCTNDIPLLSSRLNETNDVSDPSDASTELDNQASDSDASRSRSSIRSWTLLKYNVLQPDVSFAESSTIAVPGKFKHRYSSYIACNARTNTTNLSQYFLSGSSSAMSCTVSPKSYESCSYQSSYRHLQISLLVILCIFAFIVLLNFWPYLFDYASSPNLYSVLENLPKFTTLTHYGMPPV